MHLSRPYIDIYIYVIFVAGALIRVYIENRAIAKENVAKQGWQAALSRLKRWLRDNPSKDIESPQAQWLLRVEVGAYMLYMERKRKVETDNRTYLAARLRLITDSPYVESPESQASD